MLAFAALGLLINEKAGIVNLGAEGMMLCAAIAGFATVVHTGNDWLGFGAGALAGALLAAAFGVLVIWLNTNQYATGLALSLFGAGFSAFVGIRYAQEKLAERPNFQIPGLADIPLVGPALFRQHPMVYLAIALTVALAWFLYRSRAGLVLRAVGESPESAHALGYPVRRIRFAAVVAGGALCGLAGAYLSTVYTPLWVEGMVAGKGWIALALTTFATWRPARVLLGAYLFGGVTMLQFHLQGKGVEVPSQFLTMLPYLATIVVLVLISRNAVVDPRQHAGVARQALLPRLAVLIILASPCGDPPFLQPLGATMTRLSKRSFVQARRLERCRRAGRARRLRQEGRATTPRRPRRAVAAPAAVGRAGRGRERAAEGRLRLRRPGRRRRLDLRPRQRPQGGREGVRRQGPDQLRREACPRRPTPSACSATWPARATS